MSNTTATPQQVAVPQPATKQMPVTVKSLLNSQVCKDKFAEVLGEKSKAFIASVIQASNQPVLMGADPKTVLSAAMVAATLDLPINPNLGFAYIVPYTNKGKKEAQFQMGWKGFYQLAMNSGIYQKITTNVVYEGEIVVKNRFTEEYEFCQATSDKVVGYLAYYKTNAGAEKYYYMSKEDAEKHAKKYSQSYRNDKYGNSQWSQNFDAMAMKTVLKLLLSKFGKLSIEMQLAHKFDQSVVKADVSQTDIADVQESDITYIDNQPDEAPEKTEPSLNEAMNKAGELFS